MDVRTTVLVLTMILVFIVLPAYFAKSAGKTPIDWLRGLFGGPASTGRALPQHNLPRNAAGGVKKSQTSSQASSDKEQAAAAQAGEEEPAESEEAEKKSTEGRNGGAAAGGSSGEKASGSRTSGNRHSTNAKPQTNSTRDDLLKMVSDLVTFARKNKFCVIFPGTLEVDGKMEPMTLILITKSRVVGINGYGYGGLVEAHGGEEDWVQTLNGERRNIPSPAVKNAQKLEHLKKALGRVGFPGLPVEVYGVFTAPDVTLKYQSGAKCCSTKDLMEMLKTRRYMNDEGLDVKKIAKALEAIMYSEKKNKKEKKEKKNDV